MIEILEQIRNMIDTDPAQAKEKLQEFLDMLKADEKQAYFCLLVLGFGKLDEAAKLKTNANNGMGVKANKFQNVVVPRQFWSVVLDLFRRGIAQSQISDEKKIITPDQMKGRFPNV